MKVVGVLQDLGKTISQQLELGNKSQITFEQITEDLGMCAYEILYLFLFILENGASPTVIETRLLANHKFTFSKCYVIILGLARESQLDQSETFQFSVFP